MYYNAESFDVAVIGAGHAGIEAALAAARLGMKTVCFTINLDAIGNMPCNPSVGGTAKGQLVREIDALGGEMAKLADRACIQYRMLNRGKGPAVYSPRAQADRAKYRIISKKTMENQKNLSIKQAEIVNVLSENGHVTGVVTAAGAIYSVKAAIICSGTYLNGRIIIGEYTKSGGPDGMFSATELTDNLKALGVRFRRFKTGTPARVNANSVDFSKMAVQEGDEQCAPFSFSTENRPKNQAVCYLIHTNENTHNIIKSNLDRSPLFSGTIEGIGPRYCPSIEDKVVRFADKPRHQLFIEPMGLDTAEMYVQGFSSSMPEDVQDKMIHSLEGLENVEVMRWAYAIEYDCIDPLQLYPTLEMKNIEGLYGAGQFCGTSGYEEAAAQGLIAGINAALKLKKQPPLVLNRADGYIGTLIDDLVTKGTNEPYRMMTGRTEYRLTARQDNADIRLMPLGHRVGLISDEQLKKCTDKYAAVEAEIKRLNETNVSPSEANPLLEKYGSTPLSTGTKLAELLRRPELTYDALAEIDPERPDYSYDIREQTEIQVKYEGYIKRQLEDVQRFLKTEQRLIPNDIDYNAVPSLRTEARQKLSAIRPLNFGQASRISGVSPADMTALMIYTETMKKNS